MMQWLVCQLTIDVFPVIRSFETHVALYGALGLKRFQGISLPSTTRTPFFFAAVARRVMEDIAERLPAAAPASSTAAPSGAVAASTDPPAAGAPCCWPARRC